MSKLMHFSEFDPIPCESRWFVPYRVPDGVTAIYEPYHFQEVISYLIEGNESALLLDSGMGIGNIRSLVEFLTDKEMYSSPTAATVPLPPSVLKGHPGLISIHITQNPAALFPLKKDTASILAE